MHTTQKNFNKSRYFSAIIIWRITNGKLEFLTGEEEKYPDRIKFPGGGSDFIGDDEEDEYETLLREVDEELSVGIKNLDKMIKITENFEETHHTKIWFLTHISNIEGELKAGDGIKEISWFTPEKLREKIFFSHKKALEEAVRLTRAVR
jgi:8-oxo-dGTP pyrophosphatase MutT (NUDIX family)